MENKKGEVALNDKLLDMVSGGYTRGWSKYSMLFQLRIMVR